MIKTTLILADIHHHIDQATKIINQVGADNVISLGDLFDNFDDTPEMIQESCDWLEWFVSKPNHIFIRGNHDIQYEFPNSKFQCSGYAQWKYFIIHDTIDQKIWDKVKYYHILDNTWLLSHAGLHKNHLPKKIADLYSNRLLFFQSIREYLDNEIIKGHRNESWIFRAGRSRGGCQPVGGITWCDHNKEMYPVIGLNQIYGHSPQPNGTASWLMMDTPKSEPYFKINNTPVSIEDFNDTHKSYNLCLDVHGNTNYAIWNGQTITIGSYKDL